MNFKVFSTNIAASATEDRKYSFPPVHSFFQLTYKSSPLPYLTRLLNQHFEKQSSKAPDDTSWLFD